MGGVDCGMSVHASSGPRRPASGLRGAALRVSYDLWMRRRCRLPIPIASHVTTSARMLAAIGAR